MSQQNKDYKITPLDESPSIMGGQTKQFKYTFENLTKHTLKIRDFKIEEEHMKIVHGLPDTIKPKGSAIIILEATVPDDYDQKHDIGLRPRFLGSVEKWLE